VAGEDQERWTEAKRQAVEILSAYARERDTISYKQFVTHIKAIPGLRYHGDKRLDCLLDEISVEEEGAGRGHISALVVQASVPSIPSDGFFDLVRERHSAGLGRREIFEVERDAVWAAHASTPEAP
jgi:hypothetical protein